MNRPPSVCASTRVSPILKLLVKLKVSCRNGIGSGNYESAQAKRVSGRVSTHCKAISPQIFDIRYENRFAQKIPVVTSFEKRMVSPPVESIPLSNVDTVDALETIRSEGAAWLGASCCNDPYDFSPAEAVCTADEPAYRSSAFESGTAKIHLASSRLVKCTGRRGLRDGILRRLVLSAFSRQGNFP